MYMSLWLTKFNFFGQRRGSRTEGTNSWVDTIYCSYLHKQETWHKCAGPRKIRNLCDTVAVRAFEPLNGTFGRTRRERNNKRGEKSFDLKAPVKWELCREKKYLRELYIMRCRNVASKVVYISRLTCSSTNSKYLLMPSSKLNVRKKKRKSYVQILRHIFIENGHNITKLQLIKK